VPEKLSINNYMGAVYINEETIFLAGGLNHMSNDISQDFQCFNAKEKTVAHLPRMLTPRYSFPLIYFDQMMFAIAGSSYGRNDHTRLLSKVEYFDFHEWKWK